MHGLTRLTLLALALAACGGDAGDTKACRPPECAPATSSYAIEVTGGASSTLPATELTAVSLTDPSGSITLNVPASAQVTGHVTSDQKPVPASVVFTRPSRIPGRPDVYYETTSSPEDGSYTLALPPNVGTEGYTVRVRPTDSATYPPKSLTTVVRSDTTLDVDLPSGAELIHFHGSLANAVSVGVSQAKVVLRDATTLDDLSTTTTTSSDGSFDVYISSDDAGSAGGVLLVAQQGDASTGLITLTLPITAAQVASSTTEDAMALELPALPATTHLAIPVVGTGSSGTVEPIAGASFRLFAPLGVLAAGQTVVHEVDGQTDASGKIQADLFSDASGTRTYSVTIVPPADSYFEAPSAPLSISVGLASGVGTSLMLALRPIVTGLVLDATATPLAGATVQPSLSTILASSTSLATSSTSASTPTDNTGRFALPLDPNTYDLAVSPPATASLPRLWISRQAITSNQDVGSVQLPRAVMFDVVVRDSSQMPVQGTVRLYVVAPSDPDCVADMGTTCAAAPQLQAEAITGSDGTASMLLPAQAMPDLGSAD